MDDNSDKPLSKQLPSFWVPSLTPVDDKSATLKKPVSLIVLLLL